MHSIPHIVENITSTEVPGDNDPQLQENILKSNDHNPCGDNSPETVCMRHSDTLSVERRNNNNSSAINVNRNMDKNRNNTTNIADYIVKVINMFDECFRLRIDYHDFHEYFVVCTRTVHRLHINDFSDKDIDETELVFCNKECRAGFPETTPGTTTETDKSQRDENRKRSRTRMRRQ